MTIKDLITELKKYPQDWNVTIPTTPNEHEADEYGNVISMEVTNVLHQNFFDDQFAGEVDELLIY